ncbi:hypothetical protein [Halorubrum sp. SD626R]|uniref:IS1096 element passenger TnpR family protein n=1 Tax=Halorubrum sp. SD626R TaxID=1419722 RepID=UPI000A4DAD81|nr:hypothetical protein [Halorubrum sp. SD626R]TKX82306.1 hypothetical protein EXE53_01540 [Halorubrum sp. SD626R]
MTTYRFRVKSDPDPADLWRDIVVGGNRALTELQAAMNDAMGLDRGHLWFIGADEAYWNSEIKFQSPQEFDESAGSTAFGVDETTYDAGETTVDEMVDRLGLDERDRICYLYDYGDERRFYAILKEIDDSGPTDEDPHVVAERGEGLDLETSPQT